MGAIKQWTINGPETIMNGIEIKRGSDGLLHTTEMVEGSDLNWEDLVLTAELAIEGCAIPIDHTKPIVVLDVNNVPHHIHLNEKNQMVWIEHTETFKEVESILIDAENGFWFMAPGVPKA